MFYKGIGSTITHYSATEGDPSWGSIIHHFSFILLVDLLVDLAVFVWGVLQNPDDPPPQDYGLELYSLLLT